MADLNKIIEKRVAQRVAKREEYVAKLAENDKFLDVQAKIVAQSQEIEKLDAIMHQLNSSITPFISKTGEKYSVRVFPVSQFGLGLDKVIGIIQGSASAFTDDMAIQYEAICGVPFTELTIARNLLGTVDYINKDGIYVEGSRTLAKEEIRAQVNSDEPLAALKAVKDWEKSNIEELHLVIQSICIKLGVYECIPTVEDLTLMIERWEQSAQRKATKQLAEIEKASKLVSEDSEFTLEEE